MSGNIYLDFELALDPAVIDTSELVRLLNEKIRYWNQHINFNPRYKLLVVEAEKSIASGLPNLREQANEARRIKWKELQDKIQIARRAGLNEAVAQKLVQRFAAFFTEETVLKELGQFQIHPSVFQPEFKPPSKPESLQCEKPVSFSDMQAITEDLRFVHDGKCKNLYELLWLPQTAPIKQLYQTATAAADRIDKMPKNLPEADPLNRLSGRFLLYFQNDIYRRSYDVALRRLPFDTLAAEVFDFYAESFQSSQKSDELLWQESVQKTVALGFTQVEAEYLVYEFYCLTRKCPPPVPLASEAPPVLPTPKQNTERSTIEKSKLSLLWILPALLAVIVIVVFFRIIDSNRITELKKKETQIQQIHQQMTTAEENVAKLEEELKESKAAAEQEKKSRLTVEEMVKMVTELEDALLERTKQIAHLEKEAKSAAEKAERERKEADAKIAAEKAEQDKWDVNINRVAGDCQVLMIKGVEYRFHWCPPGTFIMGSPKSEKDRQYDETQHQVTLTKGFWMAETETTQEQWEKVMGNNPSIFKRAKDPVGQVSWIDCQEFIGNLNAIGVAPLGFKFSFPTEAQWEYACRAGTTGSYAGVLDTMAWHTSNGGNTTHPVGTKKANAWGLYDMLSNVQEWCYDRYENYPAENVTDPTGASNSIWSSNRVYQEQREYRVIRGGNYNCSVQNCRLADRTSDISIHVSNDLGLRLSLVSVTPLTLSPEAEAKAVAEKTERERKEAEEKAAAPRKPVSIPVPPKNPKAETCWN